MVSFDVTSLYTNIPIIDTLNIIKDCINNDDLFTMKTAIPEDKFLVLQPQWKFVCRLMNVLQEPLHCTFCLERFVDDVYSIIKRTHLENFFHRIQNLHQKIRFTMEEEINGKLALLDTLLKQINGEISVLVYRKPTPTDQNLHYGFHHETSCKESVVSSLFNTAYSIITNKDDLQKENARIKQVLKGNGYRENITNKIFKRVTNNHSLPQSQKLAQAPVIQEE